MTSLALSVPAPRLAETGRPRLAICARTVRPPRAEAVAKDPADLDEDDDLGPWVRLPDGGLEFRG